MNIEEAKTRLDGIYAEMAEISDQKGQFLSPAELGELSRRELSLASEAQQLRVKYDLR